MSDKGRQRNRDANIRGGLGVRHRNAMDAAKNSYRLNGVPTGSAVARCLDKYGRWEYGYTVGVIVRRSASTVHIHWIDDEAATIYSQGDARYEVDRNRWRILGILQPDPLNPVDPLASALRAMLPEKAPRLDKEPAESKNEASAIADTPPTEETDMEMSKAAAEREAAKKQVANGDLKDRDTYTAKQVATRLGTDSKTLRKFFRTPHSTVEAVGQGGRYEFDAKDLPKIKREFDAWVKRSQERSTRPQPTPAETPKRSRPKPAPKPDTPKPNRAPVPEGFGGIDRFGPDDPDVISSFPDADEEPTAEDLAELDDLDLDMMDD